MALLLAVCSLIPLAWMAPRDARAADTGHSLYYWTDDRFTLMPGTGNVKFTTIGRFVKDLSGMPQTAGTAFTPCAVDVDGNTWWPDLSHPSSAPQGWLVPGTAVFVKQSSDADFAYRCSKSVGASADLPLKTSGPASYRSNGSSSIVGADRRGVLWWTATPTPQLFADSHDYTAFQVAQYSPNSSIAGVSPAYNIPYMLADPRADQTSTVVNQTPTTGAPASDWVVPAIVLAAGMMVAAGVMIRRRRA